MPKLDFSQQAEPATPTLDFSSAAEPVDDGLSLHVDPRAVAGLPAQQIGLGGDVPAASVTPAADAAGEGLLGSLATSASVLPLAAGGANTLLHMPETRDMNFGLATDLRNLGDRLNADAANRSSTGATAGNVAAILPQLLASPLLASQIVSGGTQPALHALDKGADVATAEKLLGLGTSLNAAANLLPAGVGGNVVARALTGGAINAGAGYAIPAAEHAVAPAYTEAPTAQDAITQGGIGAILAAALGHGAAPRMAGEPRMEADPVPLGMPRGADFSAKAEPVRPGPVDLGGAVHVGPGGEAATPAQGTGAFAQAIDAARARVTPPGLTEPVVAVDRAGQAATTADQHAAMQPSAPTPADPLGLSDRLRQMIANDPRTAREGEPIGPKALPAPTIAVDANGNAQTTSQFQQAIAARQQAAADRQALGITPDIERSQGVRWSKQQQAAAVEAERQARLSELDQSIAAREAQNVPARGNNAKPDETVDDALTFLAKKGGLDRRAFVKEGLDPAAAKAMENRTRGGASRPLFKAQDKGGMSLDHAAEALWQHGYLPEQDNNAALDMILGGVNQDQKAYSIHRQDQGDLLAMEQARNDAATHPADDFADVPFSFAGERAHTADRGALSQAQQMEAMGRDSVPDRFGNQPGSPEDTHIATGWHRGVDGKWKFEIDDSAAKLDGAKLLALDPDAADNEVAVAHEAMAKALRDGDHAEYQRQTEHAHALRGAANRGATVGELMNHPDLFAAYPALSKVKVQVLPGMKGLGAYNTGANVINIRAPTDYPPTGDGSLKSVLLHEIQHAIQDHEGFARGGSASEFEPEIIKQRADALEHIKELTTQADAAKQSGDLSRHRELLSQRAEAINALDKDNLIDAAGVAPVARRQYQRLAGEVEARNTQRRLPMDAAQRRAIPPSETADTPRGRQIVRFNADRAERSGPNDQDAQAIATYNAKLSDYIGQPIDLTPAAHVPDAARRALAAFDDAFGSHTIVVHNGTPDALDFNGVTLRDGVRLVNEDATSPLLTVAGHEMVHQLRKDAPELYGELEDEVRRQGRLAAYEAVLNARARASGEGRDVDPRVVAEELTADATGDALSDPEFIERLAKQNPSLFRRLADRLRTFFDALVRKLRGLGSSPFLADVEAFRTKLADVLERYAEGQQAKREPMAASEETSLSRKPVDDQTDTPAFRKLATELPKSVVDRLDGHAKALSDLLQNPPFSTKSPGFMNVPSAVVRHMLGVTENPEILGAVVRAIPVDVVNFLARKKITPEHLLSDETVLKDVLSVNGKTPVSLDINESASIVRVVAKTATELADLARGSLKASPAGKTINSDSILGAHAANDVTKTAAFSRWFGDSKVVDADGKPLVVYHGTGNLADMDQFRPELTGKGNDQIGSGFYFTTDPSEASSYTTSITANAGKGVRKLGGDTSPGVAPVYLSIKNPIRVKGQNLVESGVSLTAKQVEAIIHRAPNLMDPEESPIGNWHDVWSDGVKPWMIADVAKQYAGENLLSLEGDFFRADASAFRHALADVTGHDGVVQDFGDGHKHWVAWFPEQIKSATGNRGTFDASNPDIRFSRKPTDDADYLQDMPSRRPGESQAAYLRRVTRKNGADIKAATALVTQQRQLGRHALRGMMATQARQSAIADAALSQARKTFDETPDVINYASVHQWETGQHIDDPDFRNFVATMQDGFDQRIAAIQKLAPGALESLIENYMPHLYEDSGKATKWYQNVMGKKPLQGDRSFLKQREWPTLKEAMASGLKPISPNPVDWVLMKYHQMDKFIGLLTLKDDFARRGWLMKMEAGQRVPEGFARVDDPAFQIAGGLQGYFAVPEMIAKDINNYLAPGLSKYGAWRSMRAVQNAMVSWNLGWSAFHAGFTSIDNAVTHGAAGLQMLVDGDLIGGLTTLAKSVPTMLTSPFEGGRLNKQWTGQKATDVHTAALLDLLEQGGARMKMNNVTAEYNNALPQVLRTLRRMKADGYVADQLAALQRRLAAEPAAELARLGWGSLKGVGKAISAIGEVGSFLIHHVLVPNQKMAARVTLMKFELDHYAKQLGKQRGDYAGIISVMHPDVARQLASDVVDKVDFRLGQMTYENFFYPKIVREVAQMLVMAPGWQAGAYQTMIGGIRDVARLFKPEKLVNTLDKEGTITDAHRGRFTNNMANLIMLFLMVGGGNALWQYLVSGKEPDEMKDIVAPRTGRKNADDSDERIVLPSYMKDHYEFFNHPLQMASHKLHPAWRLMWEVGHNEDYFGNMIRDPHHPLGAQAKELAGYLLKSMLPFSATNVAKVRENGGGFGQHVANFVGVTPASASLARSKFQAFVAKGGERGWDGPAQTPTQAEYNNRMRKAENAMRTGQQPDLAGLNQQDVAKLQRRVRTFKPEMQFDRLSLADKLDAYELATPEERTRYHLTEVLSRTNPGRSIAFRRLPEEEKQALLQQLARIRQGKAK